MSPNSPVVLAITLALVTGLVGPAAPVLAEVPDTVWVRIYGGAAPDAGCDIIQLPDSGFVVVGETESFGHGKRDVFLIRTDAAGDSIWLRAHGGADDDYPSALLQTFPDSGFIIIGTTKSFGAGRADVLLLKTDAAGEAIWMKTFGRPGVHDYGTSINRTDDGGYIVAGHSIEVWSGDYDIVLIKTDADGDTLWTRTYGHAGSHEYAYSVGQVADGGYVIAGRCVSLDGFEDDVLLIRTYASGEVRWERRYGGPGNDYCLSFKQTGDGGFILVGYTTSYGHGASDVYLIKTDAIGGLRWERTYGGPWGDCAYDVERTPDGGYIIAGETYSFGEGQSDVYVIKTDYRGRLIWARDYGCSGVDGARSITRTSDGGYAIVGRTRCFGAGQFAVLVLRMGPPPVDVCPPSLSLGIFQNPYLSRYLDICMVSTEALDSASVDLRVDGAPIPVRSTSYEEHVFVGDYRITPPGGVLSVVVTAADVAGNDTTVTAEFSCVLIAADMGGVVLSPDGVVTLGLDKRVLAGDVFVLITPLAGDPRMLWDKEAGATRFAALAPLGARPGSYNIGPQGIIRTGTASIEFTYDPTEGACRGVPGDLLILNPETGPLESYVDPEGGVVCARTEVLGTFLLACGEAGTSHMVDPLFFDLGWPYPNPAATEAVVEFEVRSRQCVRVDVYDICGRHITRLFDGTQCPGRYGLTWDGTSIKGERVAGGTYLIRVTTEHASSARKVILLR